ncbi:MAG TPA: hypothetical protein PLX02_00930 [Syntrophorhabdaceae bacterium]|nr:hypothetical protein [Syntrophorhabdaceae bacterium]HQM80162.1 hypothetical protein [Syntrophorhabdaceae bacterium]
MIEIKLEPSLSSCIETVAKREYERVLSILLKRDIEDRQLEEELELLRLFLESADFGQLRSLSEDLLLDGSRVECILRSASSPPGYEAIIKGRS